MRAHFVAGGLERTLHDIGVVKGDVRIRNEGGMSFDTCSLDEFTGPMQDALLYQNVVRAVFEIYGDGWHGKKELGGRWKGRKSKVEKIRLAIS